jgi:uncharacterized membrane protein
MSYKILDNAYWEDGIDDRSVLKCIRMHDEPGGKQRKEIINFSRLLPDRSLCPQYKEVVSVVGQKRIDDNTTERRKRKAMEQKTGAIKKEQQQKTQMLEKLFALKLQAFEIPEIRDSTNKKLRTKLRRAQNEIEMNAYATLLIGMENGIFKEDDKSE